MLLDGKTIIVTGAAGGLGEAIARVCYREGANVVIADINGERAQAVAHSLGARAVAFPCDVGDDRQLGDLVRFSVAQFHRIDGLVNNAGVNFVKPFLETTAEDWDRVIRIDLRAVFFLTQLVCQTMMKQTPTGGSVVNISSVHSYAVLPGSGPYDAAKWGVVGLAKSIAVELARSNIRVNIVSPGLLNTQIWTDIQNAAPDRESCLAYWKSNIPIQRIIEPEEIAEVVVFVLSDRSSCMTGSNVFADGGMTSQLVSQEPYQSTPLGSKTTAGNE